MEIINLKLIVLLQAYVSEWLTLSDFKDWMATKIWELMDSPSPIDRMAVGELQIALSEFDRGDRDETYIKTVSKGLLFILNAVQRALATPEEVMMTSEASLVGLKL